MASLPPNTQRIALIAAIVCALGVLAWLLTQKLRRPSEENERVQAARANVEPGLRELCRAADLSYPPDAIFLRAFKHEAQLEVWARMKRDPFRLLLTLPVLFSSGNPGPKRKEGDRQVPEGFYAIDLFNPASTYHLSLRINYPNDSDRILSDPQQPGSDIYIHGADGSVGCLPLGDPNIEKLFVLAADTVEGGQQSIPIHLFPARMTGATWDSFFKTHTESNPQLAQFWKDLKTGYDAFEQNHQVAKMIVEPDGRYRLER
jgi:murein L,D-transpeptidase YafK